MQYDAVVVSPLGKLGLQTMGEYLIKLDYLPAHTPLLTAKNKIAEKVTSQLENYFAHSHFVFSLPLELKGTTFERAVWHAMQTIPAGSTQTYGDLAKQLKSSPRAVGNACRKNPVPIIVPCHRIVAANHLGGYSGHTQGAIFDIKKYLLRHEGYLK